MLPITNSAPPLRDLPKYSGGLKLKVVLQKRYIQPICIKTLNLCVVPNEYASNYQYNHPPPPFSCETFQNVVQNGPKFKKVSQKRYMEHIYIKSCFVKQCHAKEEIYHKGVSQKRDHGPSTLSAYFHWSVLGFVDKLF